MCILEEAHLSLEVVLVPLRQVTEVFPVHLEYPPEVCVGDVVLEVGLVEAPREQGLGTALQILTSDDDAVRRAVRDLLGQFPG